MKTIGSLFLCLTLSVCAQAAQLPVALSSAGTFSVLGASTVTNTGPTTVNGNLGVGPGSAVTGFPPGIVVGTVHIADGPAAAAQGDLTTAYNDAAGRTVPAIVAGDLGGLTLTPGLYKSTSTLGITGVLTLDGQGNPNSVFIFQVGSALTTAVGSQVVLIGGAQAANIFWQVGSSAVLGTNSLFQGTIMAQASVTLTTGATLNGRALARTAAVTMDSNGVFNPGPPTTGGTPATLTLTCPTSSAQVGVAYNSLLGAAGGTPPYLFSITGSLPAGLSLSASTGAITGTPTGSGGASSFSANVQDSASGRGTQSCSISTTVGAPPALTLACPTSAAQVGAAYNSILEAAGGTRIYTFSIPSGSLPPGLGLSPSTGAISGTPTGAGGANAFVANVVDSASNTATQNCTITASGIPSTTPAPSSLILVLTGLGGVALYRSRDRIRLLVGRN